jgi:hypothetical protein
MLCTYASRARGAYALRTFAGRRVISGVATAIFTARGWRLEGGEGSWVARKNVSDREQRTCYLQMDLPDVYHYLSEEEFAVLGDVECHREEQVIALDAISDATFSECMRDLDLIITAGAADSDRCGARAARAGR